MQVLITGGSGFIGRALCAALVERGDAVVVLSRRPDRVRGLPAAVRCIHDPGALEYTPDAIVNLAGENLGDGRWTAARKQRFIDSRVQTTERLIAQLAAGRVPRVLVSASAIGWYGARGDETLDESAAPGRDDEFTVDLCRRWEAQALRAESFGVRVCRLRIGVVLDAGGGSLAKMLPPFRLGLGGPIGDGRQWFSWIHRADLVALILWLLDTDTARGVYNGTAPQPVRNAEFAAALGAALRRPAVLPMPAAVLRGLMGEMAELVVTGQRVVPARSEAQGFRFRYPDIRSALHASLGSG